MSLYDCTRDIVVIETTPTLSSTKYCFGVDYEKTNQHFMVRKYFARTPEYLKEMLEDLEDNCRRFSDFESGLAVIVVENDLLSRDPPKKGVEFDEWCIPFTPAEIEAFNKAGFRSEAGPRVESTSMVKQIALAGGKYSSKKRGVTRMS
jgi:hypothetical protein